MRVRSYAARTTATRSRVRQAAICARIGQAVGMPTKLLRKVGVRGWHLHVCSLASVALCIVLWIRAKTIGEDERGNAERRALFVGLWPPTFWLIGDSVERHE